MLLLLNLNFEMFQKVTEPCQSLLRHTQIDKIERDVRRKVSRNWDILSALNKYFYDFIMRDASMIGSEIWTRKDFLLFCKINEIEIHKIL